MLKLKILVLTDYSRHTIENALYPIARAFARDDRCLQIDVASRGSALNDSFFKNHIANFVYVNTIDQTFSFDPSGQFFKEKLRKEFVNNYNVVLLRMPPPLDEIFLSFLSKEFPNQLFINDPKGILETGSKAFLLNFPELCAPMKTCRSIEDIITFKKEFPIVLKPFREYGGKGIIRIDEDKVWIENRITSFEKFAKEYQTNGQEYLGVKYLKNISQGDKRIVVVAGKIMGASLRLPPKDSWICNVAMGGSSYAAKVDENEIKIIEKINPVLEELGIIMYGVDTLVNDDGRRILSEINTTSIGGLPQIEQQSGLPVIQETIDLFWNHFNKKNLEKNAVTNR